MLVIVMNVSSLNHHMMNVMLKQIVMSFSPTLFEEQGLSLLCMYLVDTLFMPIMDVLFCFMDKDRENYWLEVDLYLL